MTESAKVELVGAAAGEVEGEDQGTDCRTSLLCPGEVALEVENAAEIQRIYSHSHMLINTLSSPLLLIILCSTY